MKTFTGLLKFLYCSQYDSILLLLRLGCSSVEKLKKKKKVVDCW